MSDKAKIVEGLHRVQTLLYDSREAIADTVVDRPKVRLSLAAVYDRLAESEEIMDKIMDSDFWG